MTTDPGYDPKLKIAMDEIKQILVKHDIAGEIGLVSETHSEYCHHICKPSWSALSFYNIGETIGIRLKVQAKTGGPEERRKAEATIHMVAQFRDLAVDAFEVYNSIFEMCDVHFDIEVTPRQHRPHHGDEI